MVLGFLGAFVRDFGYLGVFLVNLLSSATIFVPVSGYLFVIPFLTRFNPVFVGLLSGLGSAIGDLVAYTFGIGGKSLILQKYKVKFGNIEKAFKKYGGLWAIILFSFLPDPLFNFIGVFTGLIGYDVKKFFIGVLIGRTARYVLLSLLIFYGYKISVGLFGW